MKLYVNKAIAEAHRRGDSIGSQDLKDLVSRVTGWVDGGSAAWQEMNGPLKDEPVIEEGKVFVPVARRKMWFYNPPVRILLEWSEEVFMRMAPEIERVLKAFALPRYRRSRQVQRLRPHVERLGRACDDVLAVWDEKEE